MEIESWLEEELSGCHFKDKRLGTRFKHILSSIHLNQGKTIPEACGDWSDLHIHFRSLVYPMLIEERIAVDIF